MNAVMEEIELMDPVTYWTIHKQGWHDAASRFEVQHYPALSGFCLELEEAADYMLDVFGISLN